MAYTHRLCGSKYLFNVSFQLCNNMEVVELPVGLAKCNITVIIYTCWLYDWKLMWIVDDCPLGIKRMVFINIIKPSVSLVKISFEKSSSIWVAQNLESIFNTGPCTIRHYPTLMHIPCFLLVQLVRAIQFLLLLLWVQVDLLGRENLVCPLVLVLLSYPGLPTGKKNIVFKIKVFCLQN